MLKKYPSMLILAGMLSAVSCQAEVRYKATEIGGLSSREMASLVVTDINNSGLVAGYYTGIYSTDVGYQNGPAEIFTWREGDIVTSYQPAGTISISGKYGLNDSGLLVGTNPTGDRPRATPLSWSAPNQPLALSLVVPAPWYSDPSQHYAPKTGTSGRAMAVNEQGDIAGSVALFSGVHAAVVWRDGVATQIGRADTTTSAIDINNAGQVLMGGGVWSAGTVKYFNEITGNAINDRGDVVGYKGSNNHAALWRDGAVVDLGDLPGGYDSSVAYDINNDGQIVGKSGVTIPSDLPFFYEHAFSWQDGVLTDLNDLIDEQSGWILKSATAINDEGQIIGSGLLNGVPRSFLLSPVPESSSWVMALIGLAFAAISRRRALA